MGVNSPLFYMEALKSILNKYINIDSNINILLNTILNKKDIQDYIIMLNQKDQLYEQGINYKNQVLGYYSPNTERINPNKKAGTHFTFFDTGDFYKSFRIYLKRDYFLIEANPIKDDDNLFKVYGTEILGLTPENITKLQNKIYPLLKKEIINYLNK